MSINQTSNRRGSLSSKTNQYRLMTLNDDSPGLGADPDITKPAPQFNAFRLLIIFTLVNILTYFDRGSLSV